MSADFSQVATHIAQGLKEHADRDGLTGVHRAVFMDRGGHFAGEVCPSQRPKEARHEYWCSFPYDECVC